MAALLEPNQVGKREDLADYIAVVDAKSTPFISMAPKGKDLGNMQFDWQVDNYSSPQLGGVVDGTDLTSYTNPSANRVRLKNYAQVFQRDLRIGFIAEGVSNVAGLGKNGEVQRGVAKRLVEIKRDMEATCLLTNQTAQADNGSVPYLTSSLGIWLTTNDGGTATVGKPPSTYQTPTASVSTTTSAAWDETNAQSVLTSMYGQTGVIRDYDCPVGTTLKRAFTSLTNPATLGQAANSNSVAATAIRTFNMEIDSTYKSSVDIFDGDFGKFILHPDLFIGHSASGTFTADAFKGYAIPMDFVELRYSQLPNVTTLPDAGGGPIRLIRAIAGLVVKNPLGFGMFNGAS